MAFVFNLENCLSDSRQALAAFGTATIDDGAAVLRCHTGAETMGTGAVQVTRLESAFGRHGTKPCRVNSDCYRTFRITGPRILSTRSQAVKGLLRCFWCRARFLHDSGLQSKALLFLMLKMMKKEVAVTVEGGRQPVEKVTNFMNYIVFSLLKSTRRKSVPVRYQVRVRRYCLLVKAHCGQYQT